MNDIPMADATATVRLATLADVTRLAAIHAAAFPKGEAWSETVIGLQIAAHNVFALLDERGGMMLARVIVDEAEIVTLAVEPAQRRQGLGGDLMGAALALAAERGAKAMFLEVDISNAPAKALYARSGFFQVGRRKRYYANGADALILRAELGPDGTVSRIPPE